MGKNPMDYNKLRELGMKSIDSLSTESWVHQEFYLYIKIVQNHPVILG
jgi:hypothetical protein